MANFRATVVIDEQKQRVLFERSDLMHAFALGVGMLLQGKKVRLEKMGVNGGYEPYKNKEGKK